MLALYTFTPLLRRDEIRTPLKTPAWEAKYFHVCTILRITLHGFLRDCRKSPQSISFLLIFASYVKLNRITKQHIFRIPRSSKHRVTVSQHVTWIITWSKVAEPAWQAFERKIEREGKGKGIRARDHARERREEGNLSPSRAQIPCSATQSSRQTSETWRRLLPFWCDSYPHQFLWPIEPAGLLEASLKQAVSEWWIRFVILLRYFHNQSIRGFGIRRRDWVSQTPS